MEHSPQSSVSVPASCPNFITANPNIHHFIYKQHTPIPNPDILPKEGYKIVKIFIEQQPFSAGGKNN
jgi:hypothetical protein